MPAMVDLHCHLGQSVEPHVLWTVAHEQGIRLPTKDYWEFYDLVALNKPDVTWEDYHRLFHWTELIQSSPVALEHSVYHVIMGGYRVSNITLIEPSLNPMFRNRSGERDLDQIILSALRGMERALVEFPMVRAGLILALDRRLPFESNAIIVRKAIKYRSRGVVGIDIQGPDKPGFRYDDYRDLYAEAQAAGLRTTVHTGEDGTAAEMGHVIETLPLNRIIHGFRAAEDPAVMEAVAKRGLTLCLCPTSNLVVGFIDGIEGLRHIVRTLWDHGVRFCFNTDNPAMLKTSVARELALIRDNGILDEAQIAQTVEWARQASFVPTQPGKNLYL